MQRTQSTPCFVNGVHWCTVHRDNNNFKTTFNVITVVNDDLLIRKKCFARIEILQLRVQLGHLVCATMEKG